MTSRLPPDRATLDAYRACEAIARAHDENFPTASRLLPADVRRHLAAFYAFARSADDWADEPGKGDAHTRRAALASLRARLHAPPGHDPVFVALAESRRVLDLDTALFERLLDAFVRDVDHVPYAAWEDVLGYCRDSAEPVGRLVLAAAGDRDPAHALWSDRLCTALQLTNFWQDLSRDEPRGRFYLPRSERARWGDARALAFAVARTRRLFDDAALLPERAPHSLRPWLRAVLAGGRRVLARVEALGPAAFHTRAALSGVDKLGLVVAAYGPALPGSSFGASFLLLAPRPREALAALHAFCRALDDEVDDAPDPATALLGFARARTEVLAVTQGAPAGAAGVRLVDAWQALGAPVNGHLAEGLGRLLGGLATDAGGQAPQTDDELADYCRAVGGGPGLAALPVFGRTDADAFALALGEALQRVNVLRDVAQDARTGRVYVPAEDLARAGLLAGDLTGVAAPPGYRAVARPLVERARAAFARARSAIPAGAGHALAPALAMGRVYEAVLEKLAADPERAWRERTSISPVLRAYHVARARLHAGSPAP